MDGRDGTLNITHAEAAANILAFCDSRTLMQGVWHGRDAEGREIACLLGAIHPSVDSPKSCPAHLMPMWLAEMLPVLFDGIPRKVVIPTGRRFALALGRSHVITTARWDAILNRVLIRCIDDAISSARPVCEGKDYWPDVEAACAQVRAAIDGGDKKEIEAAARTAAWTAEAAAWTAAEAAAWTAVEAAAWTAAWAAEAAARTAAWAAEAAARTAAWTAAHRRIFDFVIDQIEAEIEAAQ